MPRKPPIAPGCSSYTDRLAATGGRASRGCCQAKARGFTTTLASCTSPAWPRDAGSGTAESGFSTIFVARAGSAGAGAARQPSASALHAARGLPSISSATDRPHLGAQRRNRRVRRRPAARRRGGGEQTGLSSIASRSGGLTAPRSPAAARSARATPAGRGSGTSSAVDAAAVAEIGAAVARRVGVQRSPPAAARGHAEPVAVARHRGEVADDQRPADRPRPPKRR